MSRTQVNWAILIRGTRFCVDGQHTTFVSFEFTSAPPVSLAFHSQPRPATTFVTGSRFQEEENFEGKYPGGPDWAVHR